MLEYGDGLWPYRPIPQSDSEPFVFVSVSCLLVFCDINRPNYYYYYLLVLSVCIMFLFTHGLNVDCITAYSRPLYISRQIIPIFVV